MSTTTFSWAFPARSDAVTAHMRSLDDVGPLLPAGDAAPHLLMSASRSDWLLATVEAIATSIGGTHLRSLHRPLTVFPQEGLPEAISEIDAVLDRARSDPAGFAALLGQGDTPLDIQDALERSAVATHPHLGPDNGGDGDSARYLFDWLKSLQALCRTARESGCCLVHAQPGSR